MTGNNGAGKISREELSAIVGKEKDPRWDDLKIVTPFILEAVEWLEEPDTWQGVLPVNLQECKAEIEWYIAEACFKSFNAAVEEFEGLCRALLLASDDEDFPEKYLPKD